MPICAKANVQDRYIHRHGILLVFAVVFYFIYLLHSHINNKNEYAFEIPAVAPLPALPSFSEED